MTLIEHLLDHIQAKLEDYIDELEAEIQEVNEMQAFDFYELKDEIEHWKQLVADMLNVPVCFIENIDDAQRLCARSHPISITRDNERSST